MKKRIKKERETNDATDRIKQQLIAKNSDYFHPEPTHEEPSLLEIFKNGKWINANNTGEVFVVGFVSGIVVLMIILYLVK